MFIPLLLSTLGLPLIASDSGDHSPLTLFGRERPECMDVAHYRTLQGIVWTCVTTVSACTWVAIHPNLHGSEESASTRFRRQVLIMIYAILAPELVTLWAMRQWMAAKRIVEHFDALMKRTNGKKTWTITHGFLVQMGGFVLYKDGEPVRVLRFHDLSNLIEEGKVDVPEITEEEINDRSKGDSFAKSFVILQTTWFVVQCIARWVTHLPVTELEVVTLAFAVLNALTYRFWWSKPQNVLIAIRVHLKKSNPKDVSTKRDDTVTEHDKEDGEIQVMGENNVGRKGRFIARKIRKAINAGWTGRVFGVPYRLLQALLRPLWKLAYDGNQPSHGTSIRMPMFYADDTDGREILYSLLISILFGGFHLIPWASSFPTNAERWIWRTAALLITFHPLVFVLGINIIPSSSQKAFALVGVPPYLIARLALLVLAVATLRSLPVGALMNIKWTTFIPHI